MLTNTTGTSNRDENNKSGNNQLSVPSISLPKGGGAISGIGEKFAANPVTGTGSVTVPIATNPGRSGFGPQLSLSYDSGSGNGPFGFGWSLALPSITRKTDKGLPQYVDAEDSDTFILSGAEDLVPLLVEKNGQWTHDVSPRTVYGNKQYSIHRYRPRIEGLFALIERWVNIADPQDTFWRSISKDNITTWYGKTAESRIADPADPARIFSWLICESYDDKGNACVYQYKPEDSGDVDLSQANERNRSDIMRSANRYLKYVFYGNQTPYFPNLAGSSPVSLPGDWYFELVFDYGEHDKNEPAPRKTPSWPCRADPFSTYRATFEVRTYRLCQRALMFHHIPDDPGGQKGYDGLVRSTDFTYAQPPPSDPGRPFYSFLLSVRQTGYARNSDGSYQSSALPPLEFTYSEAVIDETVQDIDPISRENLPYGLDGTNYRWVDLDGEGLSGVLTEQAGSWFYKPNLSPANLHTENGALSTLAQFGPSELVARQPSLSALQSGRQQLLDLTGDGRLDLVQFESPTPGFFERTQDEDWMPFTQFTSLPVLDWRNPNLKFVDLTGDGFADLLISEEEAFWWHTSLAGEGFGPAQRVEQALDEEQGPKLIFADGTESIFLADISGDGLVDLVRIRSGEVCYWPNLGYGNFGAKVTMDQAPWFEASDLFDGRRIRLADIDGSGTADILYFASGGVHIYFNQSGNAWSEARVMNQFPPVESVSSATVIDLLGNGTACLVWSSPLPNNTSQPMCYVDLMGGQKPHLLIGMINNLGAETRVQYAPSTRFYVADKLAGTPWLTRIPFPVHVVERVITYDYISRNRFVTRYAYHHGYYDGYEREFRGFGMVEQWDTEELAALTASGDLPPTTNEDDTSYVPPVLTRTWFHTGVFFGRKRISRHFEDEYYHESDLSEAQLETMLLDDSLLPTTVYLPDETRLPYDLSDDEAREACRSLKGSPLRQEIYALDGTGAQNRPYSVSEHNYTIELLQPQGINRYAVFFTHARETIDFHYERALFTVDGQQVADPRVSHSMLLATDIFGNVLQTVAIGYGRRYDDPDPRLADDDRQKQKKTLLTCTENQYTNAIHLDDAYRVPLLCDACTYELIHAAPDANQSQVPQATNLLHFDTLSGKVQLAGDGKHDLPYEDSDATGAVTADPYRRPIEHSRSIYRSNDLSKALALGVVESMALPFETYRLALTPGLIGSVYQRQSSGSTEVLLSDPVSVLRAEGGYVLSNDLKADGRFPTSDPDVHWWIPSGHIFYSPNSNDPAAQELAYARLHFFLPHRYRDPFYTNAVSTERFVTYDTYDLLMLETRDPFGNRVTVGERLPNGNLDPTKPGNDYRVLQPTRIMDANRNRSAVKFDVLGMVVGTAVMGKPLPEKVEGDTLDGFDADLSDSIIAAHLQDPLANPQEILQQATTRLVYDVFAYWRTRNDPQPQPAVVYTLARETHAADLGANQQTKFQHSFSYSDGYGREIQKKMQAEPGPVPRRDANGKIIVGADGQPVMTANDVSPCWVGSGWTVFNNKGRPVRQYEPFFTDTYRFEFDVRIGVSPVLFYDQVERIVATLHPNNTYEKVVFDPWKQTSWDVNDTVLLDPKTDPDVGAFFRLLPNTDYLPTWYDQRHSGSLSTRIWEKEAADKAKVHANTPTTAYFDTLGHTFLTIAHNRFLNSNNDPVDVYYPVRSTLDIQGRQRAVSDEVTQANQLVRRLVMSYDYDMPGNRIHQASMEAGERWMLGDVTGKPIYAWDRRGHTLRTVYDVLRRPIEVHLREDNGQSWMLVGRTTYGESQSQQKAEQQNLLGKVYQVHDQAGLVTSESYDFKGNLLNSSRQLVDNSGRLYTTTVDWSTTVPLEMQSYTSRTTYDALNRPIQLIAPHSTNASANINITQPVYNEANLLEALNVWTGQTGEPNQLLDPTTANLTAVKNLDYNAKGQRILIEYGNGVSTQYSYDPLTFRLVHLLTQRNAATFPNDCPQKPPTGWPGCQVQNLSYTYDPIGNITHMQDDAQQTIYFNNHRVEPSADYTYDASYRLIVARGREHLGQAKAPIPLSYDDGLRIGLAQPGDGQVMGTYLQQYDYDEAGDILHMIHQGTDPANPGWTRTYIYKEQSQLEVGKPSNRLTSTQLVNGLVEPYTYDVHGNMTGMPHLSLMQWDYRDQLQATSKQNVTNGGTPETTYYVYDASGQRVRKITEGYAAPGQTPTLSKERIYLGGFEIYREYSTGPGGTVAPSLERETLHVMDDKQRIALVETRTLGSDNSPQQFTRYQFSNHLGTASLELDDYAQIISYEEYYPYGSTSYQALGGQTETPKRYKYTGKERDEESGLYYHGARYYACWLGRWTSADPLGLTDSENLYEYCRNSPTNSCDPNGTAAQGVHLDVDIHSARLIDPTADESSSTQDSSNNQSSKPPASIDQGEDWLGTPSWNTLANLPSEEQFSFPLGMYDTVIDRTVAADYAMAEHYYSIAQSGSVTLSTTDRLAAFAKGLGWHVGYIAPGIFYFFEHAIGAVGESIEALANAADAAVPGLGIVIPATSIMLPVEGGPIFNAPKFSRVPKLPTRLIHRTEALVQDIDMTRIVSRTEGTVYAATEDALWTGGVGGSRTIIFEGEAVKAFRPHPVEGWFSLLKRLGGQYNAGFGDLEILDSELKGLNTLVVRRVRLVEPLQSPWLGQTRLWGRRILVDAAPLWLVAMGAAIVAGQQQSR